MNDAYQKKNSLQINKDLFFFFKLSTFSGTFTTCPVDQKTLSVGAEVQGWLVQRGMLLPDRRAADTAQLSLSTT